MFDFFKFNSQEDTEKALENNLREIIYCQKEKAKAELCIKLIEKLEKRATSNINFEELFRIVDDLSISTSKDSREIWLHVSP